MYIYLLYNTTSYILYLYIYIFVYDIKLYIVYIVFNMFGVGEDCVMCLCVGYSERPTIVTNVENYWGNGMIYPEYNLHIHKYKHTLVTIHCIQYTYYIYI